MPTFWRLSERKEMVRLILDILEKVEESCGDASCAI